MYVVLEFERKECSVVPLNWLTDDNNHCFWPNSGQQKVLDLLVAEKANPLTSFMYTITLLLSESYEDASAYLAKAIEESSDSSEGRTLVQKHIQDEEIFNTTPSRTASRASSVSGSVADDESDWGYCDGDNNWKEHSKETGFDTKHEKKRKLMQQSQLTASNSKLLEPNTVKKRKIVSQSLEAKALSEESGEEIARNSRTNNQQNFNTSSCLTPTMESLKSNYTDGATTAEELRHRKGQSSASHIQTGTRGLLTGTSNEMPSLPGSSSQNIATCTPTPSSFLIEKGSYEELCLTKFETVLNNQNQLSIKLDNLQRIVALQNVNSVETPNGCPSFPISNKRTFEQLESFLKDPSNFAYLRRRLAAIGGSSVSSATRYMLKFIMTNAVAQNFNWAGRDKYPFKKTLMASVIREAVKLAYASEPLPVKDKDIEETIKIWLKQATGRINSKTKKNQSSN